MFSYFTIRQLIYTSACKQPEAQVRYFSRQAKCEFASDKHDFHRNLYDNSNFRVEGQANSVPVLDN